MRPIASGWLCGEGRRGRGVPSWSDPVPLHPFPLASAQHSTVRALDASAEGRHYREYSNARRRETAPIPRLHGSGANNSQPVTTGGIPALGDDEGFIYVEELTAFLRQHIASFKIPTSVVVRSRQRSWSAAGKTWNRFRSVRHPG